MVLGMRISSFTYLSFTLSLLYPSSHPALGHHHNKYNNFRAIYDVVVEDLDAMGKARYFLDKIGGASRMKIVVNMIMGGMLSCFVSFTVVGHAEASNM